jgi:hypothetical protein
MTKIFFVAYIVLIALFLLIIIVNLLLYLNYNSNLNIATIHMCKVQYSLWFQPSLGISDHIPRREGCEGGKNCSKCGTYMQVNTISFIYLFLGGIGI